MTSPDSSKSLHFKILILGAGSGGISAAARLRHHLGAQQVAVVDPSEFHYYQPLWTLVGGGIVNKEASQKPMSSIIPHGVHWIKDSVQSIDPTKKTVLCQSGKQISYDYLLVATGLKLDFDKIKGLDGHLGKQGVCSIYQYQDAEITHQMLEQFHGGTAIFTMPPVPIKCAGAPQKIMYLADEIFRKNGVRKKSKIIFATAGKAIFGIPAFAAPLMEVVRRKNIELCFSHNLKAIDASGKKATFEVSTEGSPTSVVLPYDLLHIVPPMSAHHLITQSGLAFNDGPHAGWLKVHPATLQHLEFPNVFGIGDVTGIPNSKTGAAIRKQAPVVVENILAAIAGKPASAQYDGYSSCPLVTGRGKVILAEFGYDGKLMPSFPMDMTKERRSMWYLKKDFLPQMYWHGMLKGRM